MHSIAVLTLAVLCAPARLNVKPIDQHDARPLHKGGKAAARNKRAGAQLVRIAGSPFQASRLPPSSLSAGVRPNQEGRSSNKGAAIRTYPIFYPLRG